MRDKIALSETKGNQQPWASMHLIINDLLGMGHTKKTNWIECTQRHINKERTHT